VAREIAGEIKVALTPQDRARLASARKVNPQAHEDYLLGRHYWDLGNEEDLKKSLQYYKQALALDPDYALVYAGLADTYTAFSDFYLPPREAMPQATAAAKRALELDDSLAEAHEAMAWIHFYYDWDWPASEREFKRAIELNPNFADAHHLYANYLASMKRREESRAEMERAEQLSPSSPQVVADAAWVGLMNREYEDAVLRGRAATAIDPRSANAHMMLALVYARTRQFPEAIAEGELGRSLDQSPLLYGFLGTVYAEAGRRADAMKVLNSLKNNLDRQYVCPYEIGTISLLLGNKDEAFRWYDKAIEVRSACMPFLWADPRLDSIRSDPRYQQLLVRMNFPQ